MVRLKQSTSIASIALVSVACGLPAANSGIAKARHGEVTPYQVSFRAPDGERAWVLRGPKGKVECELPCDRAIIEGSGNKLQHDAADPDDIVVIDMPASFGFSRGRELVATPNRGNSASVAFGFGLGGLITFATALPFVGIPCSAEDPLVCEVYVGGFFGALGVGLIGMGVYGLVHESPGVDLQLAAGPVRVQLGPGGVAGTF